MKERRNEQASADQISLLYIEATEQASGALERAVRRIRHSIRAGDDMLLLERRCAILLWGTPFAGAVAVAGRIKPLLADVEYELRIIAGRAALTLVRRLQARHARPIVQEEAEQTEPPDALAEKQADSNESLPYLAFLAAYPSLRLLHLLSYEFASHYGCVPIGEERGTLTIATSHQLDQRVVADLEAMTQRTIFQVRCEPAVILDLLNYWRQHHSARAEQRV